MPSRNITRYDENDSYYHVYARGASKAPIFLDSYDKDYFIYLFTRHLSKLPSSTKKGYVYPHYRGRIELLSYCLMDNHFHLLIYQIEQSAMSAFMQSLMLSYTTYFNRKYGRTGPLFESRFKASRIYRQDYLMHITRYIHLNPRNWKRHQYSSYKYYKKGGEPEWLQIEKILSMFPGRNEYAKFVADYEDSKNMLSEIKHDLADK